MELQVTGRNLDVTPPIVEYAERKLSRLGKLLSDSTPVELELSVERNPSIAESQVAEATIWTKGLVLRARETSTDMYASIDLMVDKLERQVKRYKDRRQRWRVRPRPQLAVEVEEVPPEAEEGALELVDGSGDEPVLVKTKRFNMKPMHPQEAALQLDLVGHDFFVFLSSETEQVAVLYRRRDGNYGLIEPVHDAR